MSHSSLKRRAVAFVAAATSVLAIAPATAFASGAGSRACGVLASGKVNCWGNGGAGQLGNNAATDSNVPVEVQGITTAKYVSVGSNHVCAVLASGKVNCWGVDGAKIAFYPVDMVNFALGNGSPAEGDSLFPGIEACYPYAGCSTTYFSKVPVEVSGISTAIQAAAAETHGCALLSSGKVKCWGQGDEGQLGNGSNTKSAAPVEVQGIETATQISAASRTSCVLLASGKVKCWGVNSYGQLGNNSSVGSSNVPVEVQGISSATQVNTGGLITCATLSSGKVNCWGYNDSGQLGNNSTTSSSVPVEVQGITTATQVEATALTACALLWSGKVKCWGRGDEGQLGNNSTVSSKVPVEVQGITTARQILTMGNGFCALLASGKVNCWGSNGFGQLGNNSTVSSKVPVEVSNVSTFAAFELPVVPARPTDTTAPDAPTISGAPSGSTTSTSASIGFTGEADATFTCSIDGGAFSDCTSPETLSGLSVGRHLFGVKATDQAGNTGPAATVSWTVTAPPAAPIAAPTVLTPAAGTKTVYKSGSKWAIKVGLLFSTGGDIRSGAQLLTVQVAVDSNGKPVSTKPSDALAPPSAANYGKGVLAWDPSGEVKRQSLAQPVWVRVGNKAGKWTVWVKLTA